MTWLKALALVASLTYVIPMASVEALTLTFEQFSDSELLTNQLQGQGLVFDNAIVATAGVSLNELEFPPHSGVNVVSDFGGPITISFATPVHGFYGFFTYAAPLELTAVDALGGAILTQMSPFNSNDALFGDAGSAPNELLGFNSGVPIARIIIQGLDAGNSFTMDDLAIPEPPTLLLVLGALAAAFVTSRDRNIR